MLMFFMSLFRQKGGRVDALLPGCPTILSEYIFITIFRLLWPFTDYYPSLIFFYWGEYSVWPLALFNQHHLRIKTDTLGGVASTRYVYLLIPVNI